MRRCRMWRMGKPSDVAYIRPSYDDRCGSTTTPPSSITFRNLNQASKCVGFRLLVGRSCVSARLYTEFELTTRDSSLPPLAVSASHHGPPTSLLLPLLQEQTLP